MPKSIQRKQTGVARIIRVGISISALLYIRPRRISRRFIGATQTRLIRAALDNLFSGPPRREYSVSFFLSLLAFLRWWRRFSAREVEEEAAGEET